MNGEDLYELLRSEGGVIRSTGDLDEMDIRQAQASGRMYVDNDGFGFVWFPSLDISNKRK
jgi:hypothetical protein